MGTSTNQRSPDVPSWRIVQRVLGSHDVPVGTQFRELWKAVVAERKEPLLKQLGGPLMAEAYSLAGSQEPVTHVLGRFDSLARSSSEFGLEIDLGREALARSLITGSGSTGFVKALFSEVLSYYVSRDLPSYVGAPGRVATTSEAIKLKSALARSAEDAVGRLELNVERPSSWRRLVRHAMSQMAVSGRE
jgi:hypothetical protein